MKVARLLGHVAGDRPEEAYYQFTLTWEEALEVDHDHGGSVKVDYGIEETA